MTWLKKIGCRGACGGRTSVVGPPRYSGRASVRTKATTARIWSALSVRSNGGIVGASPCAGPPCVITLTRNSSGKPFIRRPSVRSAGRVPKHEAEAALQIRVTDGAVHVDHAFFEALEEIQVQ